MSFGFLRLNPAPPAAANEALEVANWLIMRAADD
jgi:hypothetical protein